MWSASLYTDGSGVHLEIHQFSQNTGWILGVLGHRKGLYRSVRDWEGWKEGGGEHTGPDLLLGVGELKQGRDSCCWFWVSRVFSFPFSLMLWLLFLLLLFIFRLWGFFFKPYFLLLLYISTSTLAFCYTVFLKFCVVFCFLFGVCLALFGSFCCCFNIYSLFYIYFYFKFAFLNFFFFYHFCLFFLCFIPQLALCFGLFCFSFVFNWLISFLVSFAHWVTLVPCLLWSALVCMCGCMQVYVCSFVFVPIYLILLFPFVWGSFCLFICFLFVCFNYLYCHKDDLWVLVPQPEVRPGPLGGSTESRTVDCQRTPDPRSINQWELPQRPPLVPKTWHHSTAGSTQHRTAHPNNKQDRNTNPIIRRQNSHRHPQTQHLTQPCPSEGIKPHLPPECRHKTLWKWSLHKWRDRPHPPQAETKSKRNEWEGDRQEG